MIQRKNSKLACADAGPVSVTFLESPRLNHPCGANMGHQLAKSYWIDRPAVAHCCQDPVRSAHQTLQP
jgi:hypothetical protein